ncbi:MAG: tRNA-dihydrouridine synthase [bacterium]
MNFWQKLKKEKTKVGKYEPILCLAPMADVTDRAFRAIIAKYGKPDVIWTEFVSGDGLFLGGRDALINDLAFTEEERPIVAQFFTSKPEMMRKSAELAVELGFDGIDINMGCPDKSVEKQGAGAKLMTDPQLAQKIILSAKEGAGKIPVSVKTRIGWNKNELETWLPLLLDTEPAVITVHTRTRKEMSLVPARWEHIARAVEIRNERRASGGKGSETLIFGNGDVTSVEDAREKALATGCDGVMIGRAIFGNPWLFSGHIPTTEEKLGVLVEHTKLFEKLVQPKPADGQGSAFAESYGGQGKSFAVMKKHFKAYVNGFDGAKELRIKLMEAEQASEVEEIIFDYLKSGSK